MSSWESEHRPPQDIESSCKVNTFHLKEELLLWCMSLPGSFNPKTDQELPQFSFRSEAVLPYEKCLHYQISQIKHV